MDCGGQKNSSLSRYILLRPECEHQVDEQRRVVRFPFLDGRAGHSGFDQRDDAGLGCRIQLWCAEVVPASLDPVGEVLEEAPSSAAAAGEMIALEGPCDRPFPTRPLDDRGVDILDRCDAFDQEADRVAP
jgi:hypothetical protein